ncbi:hypothetical protein STEG23_019200 [Scotinomys teguina]
MLETMGDTSHSHHHNVQATKRQTTERQAERAFQYISMYFSEERKDEGFIGIFSSDVPCSVKCVHLTDEKESCMRGDIFILSVNVYI